jgi:hypothetical protein
MSGVLFTVSGKALAFARTSVGVGPAARADAPALSLRPAVTSPVPAPPSKALPVALDVYEPYQPQRPATPAPSPGDRQSAQIAVRTDVWA